jgi:hypothetical protein
LVAVDFVEAARFWGGQLFVLSSAKLRLYACPLRVASARPES